LLTPKPPGAQVEHLPFAADDEKLLQRVIAESAERADLLILSGGVSMGIYDFTKTALRALGAEIFFERVRPAPRQADRVCEDRSNARLRASRQSRLGLRHLQFVCAHGHSRHAGCAPRRAQSRNRLCWRAA
jgi:hypothetical protein